MSVLLALQTANTINLAGASSGTSAITGNLTRVLSLAGAPSGTSSIAGNLTQIHRLLGSIAGGSSTTGSLTISVNLAGASSGTSTVTGLLLAPELVWSQGSSIVTGTLTADSGSVFLSGIIAGTSTVTGTLTEIAGGTAGFEIPYLLGRGGHTAFLAGSSNGRSLVTGNLTRASGLAGTPSGSSIVGRFAFASAADKAAIAITHNLNTTEAIIRNALDGVVNGLAFGSGQQQAIGHYVQFRFPTPERFVRVTQDGTGGNVGNEWPRASILLASNDGIAWTELASRVDTAHGVLNLDVPLHLQAPYLYYRIQLNENVTLWHWGVNEFQFYRNLSGSVTSGTPLTVLGPQNLSGSSHGSATVRGEIFVNAIRNLSGTTAGSSTVIVTLFSLTGAPFDPRLVSHMYLFVNVGVGFDPTDIYPGATQTFPDGHTRDDFWEYLYIFINVGAGFDPTDDASDRPDFISQTFPDGHTRDDFWEYLYLYLNVVRGFQQRGQLVIRPGFTRGPILPGARPPKQVPQ